MKIGENVFDASYRMGNGLDEKKSAELCHSVQDGSAYIEWYVVDTILTEPQAYKQMLVQA